MLKISDTVKELYPQIKFGIMVVQKNDDSENREDFKYVEQTELSKLKEQNKDYERKNFVKTEPACYYRKYYKKFNKTYPVLLQMESLLFKNSKIPDAGPFIEPMFLAEVKNLILTAGHDFEKIKFPLQIDAANGGEVFTGISNFNQTLVKDDLFLSDNKGVLSSIMNGPDYHTRISSNTKKVMYFVYGMEGLEEYQIMQHMKQIENYIKIYSPSSETTFMKLFSCGVN